MNSRPTSVIPRDDYTLEITFSNHEMRVFDMWPYLKMEVFQELNDLSYFLRANVNRTVVLPA